MRKYPWPKREGTRVYLVMPNGEEAELDPLTVAQMAKAWVDVVAGLSCYQAANAIPRLMDERRD